MSAKPGSRATFSFSRQNYAIDLGLFPLGSCTMKHNPRLNEKVARIMLHRARAERKEAEIDRVILAAEAGIMPHRLRLGQAGQADRRTAREPAEAIGSGDGFRQVDARAIRAADLEDQRLLQHQRAIAGEGGWGHVDFGRTLLGAPAARIDRHANASSSAVASVSTSSALAVSVTATTMPFARSAAPG